MAKLSPAVDNLLNSGKYALRGRPEIFTEHELKGKDGKVVRKVTKADLEKIAEVNNRKAENGCLTPAGIGHTYDDQYDAQGKLIRKFPEEDQPQPIGYYYRYSVEHNPQSGKYSLYADEYVQRQLQIRDAKTNEYRTVDGVQYAATFPRRSAEIYHSEGWIDWVAMIRRAPRLDLAIESYAHTTDPSRVYYARTPEGVEAPACEMAKGKTRYSFDTGEGDMADNPTNPPNADPKPDAADTGGAGDGGAPAGDAPAGLPPEHQEAAEQYARHTHGMHHTRVRHLMSHLHKKYAAECGLNGDDPMSPHEQNSMAAPSGSNAGPAPTAPEAPAKPPSESTRMSQDQAAIEKERYERRLTELENGLKEEREKRVAAEQREAHATYERELMQLVYEGYEIDAAGEMKFVTDRKYSRQQFDDHISILRRMPKAPISDDAPIDPHIHQLRKPVGPQDGQHELYERNFDKIQRYIRDGLSSDEAFKKATGKEWDANAA